MGVFVEEFGAFEDAGRKRIAWGVRGMKCNMTIGKKCRRDVHRLHGRKCGVRWIFAMNVNANTPCSFTRSLDRVAKRLNSRTLFGVCTPERL